MELLQVADAVAREKNIDKEHVLEAMEEAIKKAGRSKYGHEHDIRARIDRKTGDIQLTRHMEVVEEVENEAVQVTLDKARRKSPKAQIGDVIVDALPPIDFGRIAAQTAKQVIVQKVREAERERQFKEYQGPQGRESSTVWSSASNTATSPSIWAAPKRSCAATSACRARHSKNGDRVRAYIYDVRKEPRGPQIFLSRTHPMFMAKLFKPRSAGNL